MDRKVYREDIPVTRNKPKFTKNYTRDADDILSPSQTRPEKEFDLKSMQHQALFCG
jgi:hypothetical protein